MIKTEQKQYRITRQTDHFVWIRWTAYGATPPRGVSHRIPRSYFVEKYQQLPDGTYVKRKTLCEILNPKNPAAVALGKIRTDKKAASSRLNGQKGGRPKKINQPK